MSWWGCIPFVLSVTSSGTILFVVVALLVVVLVLVVLILVLVVVVVFLIARALALALAGAFRAGALGLFLEIDFLLLCSRRQQGQQSGSGGSVRGNDGEFGNLCRFNCSHSR